MVIEINPISTLLDWIKRKESEHERIAAYIESIAEEASKLAKVWETVSIELCGKEMYDIGRAREYFHAPENTEEMMGFYASARMSNSEPYYRLNSFYKHASKVVPSNNKDDLDLLIFRVGKILNHRAITRDSVLQLLENIGQQQLFHHVDSDNFKPTILDSVDIMHKEAAALHEFARRYRANQGSA